MWVRFWVPNRNGNKEANKSKWASNHIPAFAIHLYPLTFLTEVFYLMALWLKLTHIQPNLIP